MKPEKTIKEQLEEEGFCFNQSKEELVKRAEQLTRKECNLELRKQYETLRNDFDDILRQTRKELIDERNKEVKKLTNEINKEREDNNKLTDRIRQLRADAEKKIIEEIDELSKNPIDINNKFEPEKCIVISNTDWDNLKKRRG